MPFSRSINVVSAHAEGEVGEVITGGILDPPGCKTMHEKMVKFWRTPQLDQIRQLILNEPRGKAAMCADVILPPCNPEADAGFLIMESEEYVPMSGNNIICVVTVLLETGMVTMKEPKTELKLDTAAGLVKVVAQCENGKCKNVEFENVPAFVFKLDLEVDVPDLGTVKVDIAYGGMMFAVVDLGQFSMTLDEDDEGRKGAKLVELGERIKKAVREVYTPVHPENPAIRGVTNLVFTEPLLDDGSSGGKVSRNATVVMPGRLDRCPCGTGTCARLAILHARKQLEIDQTFRNRSFIGTEFFSHIRGVTKVGEYDAVIPVVKGRGWITGFKQLVLDSTDPFDQGFRVSDAWHTTASASLLDHVLEGVTGQQ